MSQILGKRHLPSYVDPKIYNLTIGEKEGYKIELAKVKELTDVKKEIKIVVDQEEIVNKDSQEVKEILESF